MGTNGFQELDDIAQSSDGRMTFMSKDLRLVRNLLRVLSLWRPHSAGVFELYVHPIMVNILLLLPGPVRNLSIALDGRHTWLSIQSLYTVHEVCIWLGHIFGNYYFRSGDLDNVLPRHQCCWSEETFKRKLKALKKAMVLSFVLFSVVLLSLFVVPKICWHKGTERFSSDVPGVHGVLDYIFYAVVMVSIVYNLGIGLALSWTMGLFYICYTSRLKGLEEAFLKWREPCNQAVYFFQRVYSRPVERSWKRISWWFIVHNFTILVVPLYSYQLAHAFEGSAYQSRYLAQFLIYLVFVLTIWLTPIIMAEQIKRREKKFQENLNDFCFGLLNEVEAAPSTINAVIRKREPSDTVNDGEVIGDVNQYTFASRGKELRHFIRFLKHRKIGLVARGYALQLNMSLISLLMGMALFLFQVHGKEEFPTKGDVTPSNSTVH